MSQDYSRINFDAGDDYLGVLLQQGRPLTDADWNTLVAQLNRRTHAGSLDTFGPAVVPEQTEDGFMITPGATGFTIGRGRIYVDGLLAENHGAGARTWDPHLAEEYRPDAVAWNAQPYLPVPDSIPAFPYLVYVDVWQREVTELSEAFPTTFPERRRLVDVAVGVDTTQRLQTVWQVRTLGVAAGTDCATPLDTIAAWTTVTAPSAGRLTTSTGIVAGEPDPCLVPPLGGYKGGENQLYRVEVQTAGAPGTATFKWSRDNASVQARVLTIPDGTHLVLDSIGKDGVLRFDPGDWIEITDDFRELSGQPGILRRIAPSTGVSDSTRTLTLTASIAGTFPVDAQFHPVDNRNTRVRKWDQTGMVRRADGTNYQNVDATNGEIVIPADGSTLLLEGGVLVNFTLAAGGSGEFHSGDWWVFAARTNNASIEILDAAPPRGIHHHYAKLGVVLSATEADDCREIWPPDRGCCTRVVRPGQSIQNAIDTLPPSGGCVCLKTGTHEIDAPIVITHSNIILHGEAPGTRVVGPGVDELLIIGGEGPIENIEVAMISFERDHPDGERWIILVQGASRIHIHDCGIRMTSAGMPLIIAICAVRCAQLRVVGNFVERCYEGVRFRGVSVDCSIEDNDFVGLVNTSPDGAFPLSANGVFLDTGGSADIRDNRFHDFNTAVWAWVGAQTNIEGNDIKRRAYPASLDNPSGPNALLYAIIISGTDSARVSGNRIELSSQIYGGVMVVGRHDEVTNNRFVSSYDTPSIVGPIGVYAGDFSGAPSGGGDFATISDNHFDGLQLAVWAMNPQGLKIADNTISGVERAGIGVILENCSTVVVAGNTLHDLGLAFLLTNGNDNRIIDNTSYSLRVAALIVNEHRLDFDGNAFEDVSHLGIAGINLASSARFANSRVVHCGYAAENFAISLGLLQLQLFPFTDVAIDGCEILETGVSPDGLQTPGIARAVTSLLVSHLQIADNRISHEFPSQLTATREHNALLLIGVPCFLNVSDLIREVGYGAALITGNVFQGPALIRLIDARRIPISDRVDIRFEKLTFANNRCDHLAEFSRELITADLYGSHMIVTGNQVKTPWVNSNPIVRANSFGFDDRRQVAVMSNYTTGNYFIRPGGSVVPAAPLTTFNVIVP